jgi:phosphoenolpyruvate synthase/pyruvate phosphate dikinase
MSDTNHILTLHPTHTHTRRAVAYRSINQVTGLLGTAVTVQTMVFGNLGSTSGTGVLFSRNPSTGENKLYGEYLIDAQVCARVVLE